jgi:hypothetical protein
VRWVSFIPPLLMLGRKYHRGWSPPNRRSQRINPRRLCKCRRMKNDSFYAGSPAQRAKAEWCAELWARFGYMTGVHLRRVHDHLVSGDDDITNMTACRTTTLKPVGISERRYL